MQIIQIADLHVMDKSDVTKIKKQIGMLYEAIKGDLNLNDEIVLCVLGDIIDKGDALSYDKAKEIIEYLKDLFKIFNVKFEFTPGNHDLCRCPHVPDIPDICHEKNCSISDYELFLSSLGITYEETDGLNLKEYTEIDLLLASSVFHKNCKYGLLDIDKLITIDFPKPTLILTHHTFLSENDKDNSAIRNAYRIFSEIENKNIIGILHGHTHGYKDITIGKKCRLVGVGPFLKQIPNVNNQVNLVTVSSSGIQSIKNYFYQADVDQYKRAVVFAEKQNTIYEGCSVKDVYERIVVDTKKYGLIPNMILKLSLPFTDFKNQIEEVFLEQLKIAESWQAKDIPESLYYNHGQYMQYEGHTGIDFVIQELSNKATSSRAIIPLIDFKAVYKSGDNFLPSFDLVQFGFNEEEKTHLVVDVYLRALEVNHFLKINLCEIYLMCNELTNRIRSVKEVGITLIAFRAQFKENFGCFAKAEIDTLDEADIAYYVGDNDTSIIITLLNEKMNLSETVIENKGIERLYNSLNAINKRKKVREEVIDKIQLVLRTMNRLKIEREKTSNYQIIKSIENELRRTFESLIKSLEGGGFCDLK